MKGEVSLMIVGAQKAGTTSLNNYLAQHPQIFTHQTLEFGLFKDNNSFNKGIDYFLKNTVDKQAILNPDKTTFVAKRVALMYNREMLLRLFESNPKVKIVIILRNPIDRAFSAFWYCKKIGMEPYRTFEQAIYNNDISRFKGNRAWEASCDYIGRSTYLPPIRDIMSIFPEDNVKILLFEEMVKDLKAALNVITSMIHLPPFNFDTSEKYNEGMDVHSGMISKITRPGKSNFIKQLLPLQYRLKLKSFVQGLNESKTLTKEKKQLHPDTRIYLKKIFAPQMKELIDITHLPIKKYWSEFFIDEE